MNHAYMAKVVAPYTMGKPYLPKKKNNESNYCILCRKMLVKHEMHDHMHGLPHHRELDSLLGNVSSHDCQACNMSSMGFDQYAKHIAGAEHQANLKSLKFAKVKPISLHKTLNRETIKSIHTRNKMLKKERKKVSQKEKKKQRKPVGQNHFGHPQRANGQNQGAGPNVLKHQVLGPQWKGNHTPLFQNQNKKQLANQTFAVKSNSSHHSREAYGPSQPFKSHWKNRYSNYKSLYQCEEMADFTSDQLPKRGSVIFHQYELPSSSETCTSSEARTSSEPRQRATASNGQPKPEMDVSTMLKEIRRALGVREPCRADREARKQSAEEGAQMSEPCSSQKDKDALAHTSAAPAQTSALTTEVNTAVPAAVKTVNTTLLKSIAANPNTPRSSASSKSSQSPGSKTKVRIAHKAAAVERLKEGNLKKVTQTTPALTGVAFQQRWRRMYNEIKNSKQMREEGTPRFGIHFGKMLPHKNEFELSVDEDLILSEGFHWESLSNTHTLLPPLAAPPSFVPSATLPPTNETTVSPSRMEPESSTHASVEHLTVAATSATVEHENSINKRKHQGDGVTDKDAVVKRRKTKSNKDQNHMDKLLAVSLREESLSQSLQDLDNSLVLARNALKVAYVEVHRLMLLRQKCIVEVDCLRAERIEILQGMQEAYSGSSNVGQAATTSAAAPTDVVHPSSSSVTSPVFAPPTNIHQTPTMAPSVTQPNQASLDTPTTWLKEENVIATASGHPSPQVQTPDAEETRPTPPHSLLAMASATVALSEQTSAEASNPPKSFCTQQEQAKSVWKIERNKSFSDEVVIIDPKDESEEDQSIEPVQEIDPRPSSKEEDKNSSAETVIDDNGNESDDLVEVTEPKMEVIDIAESENEDSPDLSSEVPDPKEVPSECSRVECTSSGIQTTQQNPFKIKSPNPVVSESEPTPPPDAVELAFEEKENKEESALGTFSNHTGPVYALEVHEGFLYTASADNTARAYNLANRECQVVFEGHTNKINSLLVFSIPNMPAKLYTGSSDQTVRIYSIKSKKCLETLSLPDRVLSLHIAWKTLFVGLASGSVATFDLKTFKPLDVFECHGPRGVSCLGTAQEGARRVLLVGSYDTTISVRDAKSGLLLRSLKGHTKTVLCMKVVNDLVFSGSSDTSIHAHNIHTGELLRIYKGHSHAVTAIVILGKVMVTACLDKLIRVYELQSHDRLQVYGGHSDMVMCMAVHKSVIYTGCYDGSIRAAKLNLMENYRCWWQNCSLIFGIAEHLVQHLIGDHSNPSQEAVKCRWRRCSAFFATQEAVKQDLPGHMQTHVDVDSKVES
ncbi:zinc finger protein 106 isoform X2 [Syngnathoides biaculeatus]|uniref:zinc finger protein 106 isoform X2 n=1 Tax=Syngnathoides biaculeatus TaxID=300417 RepID=UPI002ADE711F|nr:zinc finger protein 106 isoform X2 [Syngnathoides biaculeatus]